MRPTTAAYAALAALDSGLAASSAAAARRARKATKSALMPLLALDTAVAATRPSPLVRGVRGAQVLSWLGDVALLGSGDRRFLLGLGSFLSAHLGYIAAFTSARDPRTRPGDPGVVAGALLFAATGPVMARLAQRQDRALAVPVLLYAGVISTMLATATTLDRTLPPGARNRIVAGSALFVLSDTLLGIGRFALPDRRPGPLDTAVMATYTAGQWLIADGAGLS